MEHKEAIATCALAAFALLSVYAFGGDRASELLESHPEECPDSLYLEFSRNGNRTHYQEKLFQRGKDLRELIDIEKAEGKGRFVPKIAEYLESYAKLRSWVLPAHDPKLEVFNGKNLYADLCASNLGLLAADALDVCGSRLDPQVAETMRSEIRRRVFDPYLATAAEMKGTKKEKASNSGHWWFRTKNNWNAVCHSCIVRAALEFFPHGSEERGRIVEAAVDAVPYYLSGFSSDGYCSEGAAYWNYGFGHFLLMGLALRSAPEGIDLFARFPKTKTIARYGFQFRLTDDVSPLFADGGGVPALLYLEKCREIWPDLESASAAEHSEFPAGQVWIFRPGARKGIALGLKCGHNGEFHNHNDVGSYDISLGDTLVCGDVGGEIYTKRTFSSQRYKSKVLNSYAHPVPRVGGGLQGTGKKFRGKPLRVATSSDRDVVELDIRGAYGDTNLVSLVRTFTYMRTEDKVSVKDTFRFAAPSSFFSPVVTVGDFSEGKVTRDGAALSLSATAEGAEGKWLEETVKNPGRPDVHIRGLLLEDVTEGSVEYIFSAITNTLDNVSIRSGF